MKKALLTCGLFSLMLVLTSFQKDVNVNQDIQEPEQIVIGGRDNQDLPKEPKQLGVAIGGRDNQDLPKEPKQLGVDIGGRDNQDLPKEPKQLGIAIGRDNQDVPKDPKRLGISFIEERA